MATIQAGGISGLDINALVQQLVQAERASVAGRITSREMKITSQISALGTLKGALSAFRSALEPLKSESAFEPRKATVEDAEVFTASAGTAAAPGSYAIEVVQLARAHQVASDAYADGSSSVVGTGTLTITVGSERVEITIDETNNTLDGIRDAINSAAGELGVKATLVHEQNGSHLVLTSATTGAESAITLGASGGDGGLDTLVSGMQDVTPAQYAHIRIAGFDHFSATNTITGAIDDVTITLISANPGTTLSLDISYDTALLTQRIEKFVSEYNALYDKMKSLRAYSPETRVAGPLLGDALLRGMEEQIHRDLIDPVSGLTGDYTTLASIGVARQVDGKLAIDRTRLDAAINTDRSAVAAMFGGEDGIAARLHAHVDNWLSSTGGLAAREQSLKSGMKQIEQEKEALERRLQSIEARYRRQFGALDALLAQMQSTASYLASQLANVPKPGG